MKLTLVVAGLFGIASLLMVYLIQTTNELVRVQEIKVVNSSRVILPSQATGGAGCGT